MLEEWQIDASIAPHYAACYCEENAFLALQHLTEHATANPHRDYYAVFVSNPAKQVGHHVCGTSNQIMPRSNRTDLRSVKCHCSISQHDAECAVMHAVSVPRQVVLWRQKAGTPPHGMVCWDYHCFAAERDTRTSSATVRVFDLDRCDRDYT